jgi:hypothetical protein
MATIIGIKKSAPPAIPLRSHATLVGIKHPAVLARYLRGSHNQITQADRDYLADFIEGKFKPGVGRPKKTSPSINFKWMFAVGRAEYLLYVWRRKYGRKHKVTLQNGKTYNLREEACERAAVRHNKRWPGMTVTAREISNRLRLPKSRRF